MSLINPPDKSPERVYHRTFRSELVGAAIGYNIYLPPGYDEGNDRYPVAYHLHGYMGNESSEIWAMEKVYRNINAITVFANGTPDNGYLDGKLPMESIVMTELIPHIDSTYKTIAERGYRSISGFSMGGAGAFYYAVTNSELFGEVTAYAGTYHHFYHKGSETVGVDAECAAIILEDMMQSERYLEAGNVLCFVRENADKIRSRVRIALRVGTADILYCDNEILHLYLNSLNIPHEYRIFEGVGHELARIT